MSILLKGVIESILYYKKEEIGTTTIEELLQEMILRMGRVYEFLGNIP